MLLANQIAELFEMQYLKKEVHEVYFWRRDKDQSFRQDDTIIFCVRTWPAQSTQYKKFTYLAIFPEKHGR